MKSPTFEARWAFMSGDARVAFVESRRALRDGFADESAALAASFTAHFNTLRAAAAQRLRFRAFRASRKLSSHA